MSSPSESPQHPHASEAMGPQRYLRERVDNQIAWHSRKSGRSRKIYLALTLTSLIAAACIPLLSTISLLGDEPGVLAPVIAGGLGVLITILSGTNALFRFHENWVDYRVVVEALKRERYLFLAGVGPYESEERTGSGMPGQSTPGFVYFVERVEELIAGTVHRWSENARRPVLSRSAGQTGAGGRVLAGAGGATGGSGARRGSAAGGKTGRRTKTKAS